MVEASPEAQQANCSYLQANHLYAAFTCTPQILPPGHLPAVYLQMCLPEGRLRMFQILQSLQDGHNKATPTDAASAMGADTSNHSTSGSKAQMAADANPYSKTWSAQANSGHTPGDAAACSDAWSGLNGHASMTGDNPAPKDKASSPSSSKQSKPGCSGCSGCFSCCGGDPTAPQVPEKAMPTGCMFWQEYSASIHVLVLADFKYAMMAQSLVGVPGVMTMLCNLSTTVDFGLDTMKEVSVLCMCATQKA